MDPPESGSWPASQPQGERWRELFADASPRELLRRLLEGDPLELRDRCARRIRTQAILLDGQRLHLRALAHVAREAPRYLGTPQLEVWLAGIVRRAVNELMAEDAEAARGAALPAAPSDPDLQQVAAELGLELEALARGFVRFNRAPFEARTALFAVLLDGMSPEAWARSQGFSVERALDHLRQAFWALGVRDVPPFEGRDGEVGDGL